MPPPSLSTHCNTMLCPAFTPTPKSLTRAPYPSATPPLCAPLKFFPRSHSPMPQPQAPSLEAGYTPSAGFTAKHRSLFHTDQPQLPDSVLTPILTSSLPMPLSTSTVTEHRQKSPQEPTS